MSAPAQYLRRDVLRLYVFVYPRRTLDCGHVVLRGGEYFMHEGLLRTACPKCARNVGWTL